MKKRVLTVFLLAVLCCLFCFSSAGSVKASALELQSEGYVLNPLSGKLHLEFYRDGEQLSYVSASLSDGSNVYSFNNTSDIVDQVIVSAMSEGFDVLFNYDLYDYYISYTIYADNVTKDQFTFAPDYMTVSHYPCSNSDETWSAVLNPSFSHFDTTTSIGFTVFGQLKNNISSSRLTMISVRDSNRDNFLVPANLKVSVFVIPVLKGQATSEDLSAIVSAIEEQTRNITGSIDNAVSDLQQTIEEQFEFSEGDDLGVGSIIEEYEEKVGLLTFASDTFLGMLDLFSPENAGEPEIVVPAWSMEIQGTNYRVWDEYRFNLRFIDENFPFLMRSVRLVTVSLFYLCIVKYIKKIAERWFLAR